VVHTLQDCKYLIGENPDGTASEAMLGPYLTGSWTMTCYTISSTIVRAASPASSVELVE
jgi:hypothetical protein